MKRRIITLLLAIISVCTLSFVFTGCGENNNGITFNTFKVSGTNVDGGKVSNAITSFDFNNEIKANGDSSYEISLDEYGIQISTTKIVPLNVGDNTFYVFEKIDGEITKAYKVAIRRKPMYNVSFITGCDIVVDDQIIEEDNLALEPQVPSKLGYIFTGWDYDFSAPIAEDTTINATWTANTNTPYKVEYYLENLEDDNYTLMSSATENLVGTTDTIVNAEIKTFEHFTPTEESVSGNINGDGLSTLKVYYKRNVYTIKANITNNGVVAGAGTYKYGEQVIITATTYLGYTFNGWYNDEERVCETAHFAFKVEKAVAYVAKFEVKEEMANFNFTSTTTSCSITGIKNKTVTEIIVPNYVNSISSGAFSGCTSLTSITLPFIGAKAGVTSRDTYQYPFGYIFGTSSYTGSYSATQYYYGSSTSSTTYDYYYIPSSLKSVTISGGNILFGAFRNCSSLTSVVIPDSVTSIGEYAFYNCDSLTSITIPNSVTSIGSEAFYYCYSLTSIVIPDSVTSIGRDAFFCYTMRRFKIYCEAESQPSGWDSKWNRQDVSPYYDDGEIYYSVVWGYKG